MRMSCNGCRVLRKGCSESCSIRPCLQWIKSPQSQANATFFLAKFYGRAGLVNLINAGSDHLRPAIFKSLLFEACGRIVNPIFGSTGLLCSGNWQLCQDAVEAVLKGAPILPVSSETAASHMTPPLKACDIRHISKERNSAAAAIHKVKTRRRFKRSSAVNKAEPTRVSELRFDDPGRSIGPECLKFEVEQSGSRESEVSQRASQDGGSDEADCLSGETVEASVGEDGDVELELTLGFGHRYTVGRDGC